MKIAIVGADNGGKVLAAAWAARRHGVVLGVRDPNKPMPDAKARLLSVPDAVKFADVLVLAAMESSPRCAPVSRQSRREDCS